MPFTTRRTSQVKFTPRSIRKHANRPRILVLGGAGYLGSVLVGELLRRGFAVRVLDVLLFGSRSLDDFKLHQDFELIEADIRDGSAAKHAMAGCDAVVHLAGIVGDAACAAQEALAIEVNSSATSAIIEQALRCHISRFIFASSCSVYGASESVLDEASPVNPLSVYAETKLASEQRLLEANSLNFDPVILRFGTLFGVSPRMRFDLIVNLFVSQAIKAGRITVWNGDQWRPFVHVRDAARAIIACLDAPAPRIAGAVLNVGSSALNFQIRTLGEEVLRLIPGTRLCTRRSDERRNYRVSFERIQQTLGFRCQKTLQSGIEELYSFIQARLPLTVGDRKADFLQEPAL